MAASKNKRHPFLRLMVRMAGTVLLYFFTLILLLVVLSLIPFMATENPDGVQEFTGFASLLILILPVLVCIAMNLHLFRKSKVSTSSDHLLPPKEETPNSIDASAAPCKVLDKKPAGVSSRYPHEYIVFDIETTGFSKDNDCIIEIAANLYRNGELATQFHTYVNPGRPIPRSITKLTGITDTDVASAPTIKEVKTDILAFFGTAPLVGHNIKGFDIPFLKAQLGVSITNQLYDTLPMARSAFPGLPSYKLTALDQALNLGGLEHHRASNDIAVTNALFLVCCSKQSNIPAGGTVALPKNMEDIQYQEKFTIPYVWAYGEDLKCVDVVFDKRYFSTIYINGQEEFLRNSVLKELGWSSDRQYKKIQTMDYVFWVPPKDYKRFLSCLQSARASYYESLARDEESRKNRVRLLQEPFYPDAVSPECLKCFCVCTPYDLEHSVSNGEVLVQEISAICESLGGRRYKTQAKSAKCAILVSPYERNLTSYKKYKDAGYMVVVPEDFLEFFGRSSIYTKEMAKRDFTSHISNMK